jgi:transposase InsO family protein
VLRPRGKESRKGKGFVQPLTAHEHWHIDVAYINIAGTFVFMATVIDGFSRLVVAWDIAPQMGETEIEILLQQGRERFPEARPRIISDNGPQFIANDFPFYPQSNGKIERDHRTIKSQCIRPSTHEKPCDNRLTLTYPQVSLRKTGLCWEATRAPERCRRPVL